MMTHIVAAFMLGRMTPPPLPEPASSDGGTTGIEPASLPKPFVQEDATSMAMHFTLAQLQSRMSKAKPWHLDVDYTRTMMGFLLLQPAPERLAMVGLGGGSLVKFCHRELAASHMTVAEINPHVIALRRDFGVPDDDARLSVQQADGAAFMASHANCFDVVLVDGFDAQGQPAALCTQVFYDDCMSALRTGGVLAVNLHYDDADYPIWLARLQRSANGNAVEIPAPEKSNCIVLASRGAALSPRKLSLQAALANLSAEGRAQLKAEFARVLWSMKDLAD